MSEFKPKIEICRARTDEDITILAKAYADYYKNSVLHENWTPESAAKMFRFFYYYRPDLFFMAYEGEKPVGCIMSLLEPWHDGCHLVDLEIFVMKESRRMAMTAKKLTQALFEYASKEQGATTVDGNTYADEKGFPLNMYERLGLERDTTLHIVSGKIAPILKKINGQNARSLLMKQLADEHITENGSKIEICRARTDEDITILASAYADYYKNSVLHENWTPETAAKMFRFFYYYRPDLFFMAYEGKKPVGCIMSLLKPWHDGCHLVHPEIFVMKEYRQMAVTAKKLTQALFEYASKEQGATTVDGNTYADEKGFPLNMYEKMGFERDTTLHIVSGKIAPILNKLSGKKSTN